MAIFPTFFLGNIGQENVFYNIRERKNPFLGYKNKKLKRSKNWHFSKGVNPWFLSKNGPFFNFYFLCNVGQENVCYDILEQKNAFQTIRRSSKGRKIYIFPNGLTHGQFWSKNGRFSNFSLLGNIGMENVFFDIVHRKNAFLAYKIKSSKSRKTEIFP